MNDFFLEGYPNSSFKLKDDIIAYVITYNYDEKTLSKLNKIGNKIFNGVANNDEINEMSSYLVPQIVNNIFNSLVLKSDIFYLEYQEDTEEKRFSYKIKKQDFFNNKTLGELIKSYNCFSDIGFSFYGENEEWGYFYGEDLYAEYPGDIIEFNGFHLFTVKKTFQKKFIDTIKRVAKNEVIIEKMSNKNIVTIDNEEVYEISIQ